MSQKKIRVVELFAGVGTQCMALRNIGINHEVVAISEIDKFAIKSYDAIHGKTVILCGVLRSTNVVMITVSTLAL